MQGCLHRPQELEITRAALTAEAEDLATFSGSEVPALQAAQSRLRLTQETLQETQRTLERRDAALSLGCFLGFHGIFMGDLKGFNGKPWKTHVQSKITEDWDGAPATEMLKLTHDFEI